MRLLAVAAAAAASAAAAGVMAEGEALPRIDHIIIGARDLNAAVDHFYTEYGLSGYEGGKHQARGASPLAGASQAPGSCAAPQLTETMLCAGSMRSSVWLCQLPCLHLSKAAGLRSLQWRCCASACHATPSFRLHAHLGAVANARRAAGARKIT